jgi:hypothetical protein
MGYRRVGGDRGAIVRLASLTKRLDRGWTVSDSDSAGADLVRSKEPMKEYSTIRV